MWGAFACRNRSAAHCTTPALVDSTFASAASRRRRGKSGHPKEKKVVPVDPGLLTQTTPYGDAKFHNQKLTIGPTIFGCVVAQDPPLVGHTVQIDRVLIKRTKVRTCI
jgi:hypothetical protein